MGFDADNEILRDFIIEAEEVLDQLSGQLVELEVQPHNNELLNSIFRGFHSIKGSAGFLQIEPLVTLCHATENVFGSLRNNTISVDAHLMDVILEAFDQVNILFSQVNAGMVLKPASESLIQELNAISEQNITQSNTPDCNKNTDEYKNTEEVSEAEFEDLVNAFQAQSEAQSQVTDSLAQITDSPAQTNSITSPRNKSALQDVKHLDHQLDQYLRVNTQRLDEIMNLVGELVLIRNRCQKLTLPLKDEATSKSIGHLDKVTQALQNAVMKIRMQPIKKVFNRFPKVVRDLARQLDKSVNLELHGEETELDKNLVEAIVDPLIHLIRNAVDHGIELPAARKAAHKPPSGIIRLSAQQAGDQIHIIIQDDGGGMDPSLIKSKALQKNIITPEAAEQLSHVEIFNLIFAPGFSTKETISDISGRGVGMDVVKNKLTQLNGTIEVQSTQGQGTRVDIKVPLTLAIMPTLMVRLAHQIFALPLTHVVEIVPLIPANIHQLAAKNMVRLREKIIPLIFLKQWLMPKLEDLNHSQDEYMVIVSIDSQLIALAVDGLLGQEEVLIKPLDELLQGTPGISGATLTGEGQIALVLDLAGLIEHYYTLSDK